MMGFNESRMRRWDPLGFAPFMGGVESLFPGLLPATRQRADRPASVYADDATVLVRAELPGFGPQDIDVTLEGRLLSVRGAKPSGADSGDARPAFERRFRMPFPVDGERVEASLRNGILEVRLARAEADRARRITVTAGDGTHATEGGTDATE